MLNELANEIHTVSVNKGFYDGDRCAHEILALIHSEVTEALDELRIGRGKSEVLYEGQPGFWSTTQSELYPKPVGFPTELADVIIRTLDAAAFYGIDIDKVVREKIEYNKTRTYKHGKKF